MEVLKSTGFIDQLTKKLKLSEVAQSGALNLRLAALVRTRLTVNPSPRVNNHCTVHLCKCALRNAQRCVLIGSCPIKLPQGHGNFFRGVDNKNIRRYFEIKKVAPFVLFSVTHIFKETKWFKIAVVSYMIFDFFQHSKNWNVEQLLLTLLSMALSWALHPRSSQTWLVDNTPFNELPCSSILPTKNF